ncbi:MAG TPA: DUF5343 domain-containing protein [Gemmatimonadales bacterium]|nr:DUF5343 domain-containing protein [Gemmatimonadales bacterium]
MDEYPWTLSPGRLKAFFDTIPTTGIPDKMTTGHLEKLGFKSKNDRRLVPILKDLRFISESAAPTEAWKAYRNRDNSRAIMANGMKEAYADLFKTYPDAHRKDNEALRNFFSSHSSGGDRVLQAIVQTFKALADLADFDAEAPDFVDEQTDDQDNKGHTTVRRKTASNTSGLMVNVNIQLTLPDSASAETYDAFFVALKKHVLS